MGRLFTNGKGDLGSIPGRVIPKTPPTKNWMPPCLTVSITGEKWCNPDNRIASIPAPGWSNYQK